MLLEVGAKVVNKILDDFAFDSEGRPISNLDTAADVTAYKIKR